MNGKVNRLQVMRHSEVAFQSGANPDFQVTSATRNAREMRLLMNNLALQSQAYDKRLAALDGLEVARDRARKAAGGRQEADPVVIEPIESAKKA